MKTNKLVCLGDSLTEGYGIDLSKRWTDLLSQKNKFQVVNSGISGDTTSGMLSRFHRDVIVHNPSHLFIMGGSNDITHNLSDETIISNIKTILRQAQHHKIECIIGIPTPYYYSISHADCALFLPSNLYEQRLKQLQSKLKIFVDYYELPLIDFSINMTPDLFLDDGVHPNEAGQVVMANIAYKALIPVFN